MSCGWEHEWGLESRVVPAKGIDLEWVEVKGLRGAGWVRLLHSPVMLVRALWQAVCVIRRRRPDALLGMGGYVAGPGAYSRCSDAFTPCDSRGKCLALV